MQLTELLISHAKREGFPLCGIVDIDLALAHPKQVFQKDVEFYDQWIQKGHAGSMEYLLRGRDRRANPKLVFPSAESVFCVALPYPNSPQSESARGPKYARYLSGQDYHLKIAEKLEAVLGRVKSEWNPSENTNPLEWKVCVDTSAVLERTWAVLAGLGWIGKNTLLIHPQLGSYILLGEVLLNQKTGQGPKTLPSYCGNCTRCLEACPTQAIEKPFVLNSNHCVSYLTLEKRGSLLTIDDKKRKKIGTWIAGCDICQEVCPFNSKSLRNFKVTSIEASATDLSTWSELLEESLENYKTRVRTSSLNRVKPGQFGRNLGIALSNYFSELDPSKQKEVQTHLRPLLISRLERETDPASILELQKCLMNFKSN